MTRRDIRRELTGALRSILAPVGARAAGHGRFVDDHVHAGHGRAFDTVGEHARLFDLVRLVIDLVDDGQGNVLLPVRDVHAENLPVGRVVLPEIHRSVENEEFDG